MRVWLFRNRDVIEVAIVHGRVFQPVVFIRFSVGALLVFQEVLPEEFLIEEH